MRQIISNHQDSSSAFLEFYMLGTFIFHFSNCLWNCNQPLWTLHFSHPEETGHLFQSHGAFLDHLHYSHAPPQY